MSPSEFDDLALLARLALSPEEKEALRHQMEGILIYVEQLKEVDTAAAPAMGHAAGLAMPLREDKPRPGLPPADALKGAPKRAWDFFAVPQVLED